MIIGAIIAYAAFVFYIQYQASRAYENMGKMYACGIVTSNADVCINKYKDGTL